MCNAHCRGKSSHVRPTENVPEMIESQEGGSLTMPALSGKQFLCGNGWIGRAVPFPFGVSKYPMDVLQDFSCGLRRAAIGDGLNDGSEDSRGYVRNAITAQPRDDIPFNCLTAL